MRPEATGAHDEVGVTQMPDDCVVEQLALLGRCRADEAGAPALARVGEQRELRDGQDLGSGLAYVAVELALVVWKDAQACDLLGQALCLRLSIACRHANQHREAGADAGSLALVVALDDADSRARDTLHDSSHLSCRYEPALSSLSFSAGLKPAAIASSWVSK